MSATRSTPSEPLPGFSPAKIPAALPLFLALLSLFTLLAPRTLRFNVTPSVPLGLYRIVREPVHRGSLVEICLPSGLTPFALRRAYTGRGPCPGPARPLLKVVAAQPGDRIVLTRLGVVRDGTLLPSSAPRTADSQGRPLPRLPLGVYRIPPGSLWLYGPHPRSFDSRTFGPVSAGLVRQTLVPLATAP